MLQRALKAFPVVVLTGARQTGKTTLLRHEPTLKDRPYLTLDDFTTLAAARLQPDELVADQQTVTIDEVQRCPELLVAIKREVDRNRSAGRFLLSGSANLALLKGVSESLAGRALYLTLMPFTRGETLASFPEPFLTRFLDNPGLRTRRTVRAVKDADVLRGGMPSVVTDEAADPWMWHLGYEQIYLERDVRELSQVGDIVGFRNLLRLAAMRVGQILNQSELGRDAKLPASTIARHLGLLEASFLLERLPPFLRTRAARLIKSPRLFWADTPLVDDAAVSLTLSS